MRRRASCQAQLFLVSKRRHRGHGFEVLVKTRTAHVRAARDFFEAKRLGEMGFEPVQCGANALRPSVEGGDAAQFGAFFADQKQIRNLAHHERREGADVLRLFY